MNQDLDQQKKQIFEEKENQNQIVNETKNNEEKFEEQQGMKISKNTSLPLSKLFGDFGQSKSQPNQLLIDQYIEQQVKIQKQINRIEENASIVSLPPNFNQQALDIIFHEQNETNQKKFHFQHQANIQITDSVQKGNPLSKYTLYTIQGEDMHGRFFVKRRFNEFNSLRKILTHRWPGCFIPGLINKLNIKNQAQKQQLMQKILINFLVELSFSKIIYYKQQVQLFIRSPDIDIQQMFDQMPKLTNLDIISRYQYAFGQNLQQMKGPKITQAILKFQKKLRKSIKLLQDMSQKTLKLAQSYDLYSKHLSQFGEVMRLYEHFSLSQFIQNKRQMTVLVKDDNKKTQILEQVLNINSYYELYSFIQMSIIDAKSFLETIIAIDLLTLRKQQLQKQIIECQKSKKSIQTNSSAVLGMATRKYQEQQSKYLKDKLQHLHQEKGQVIKLYNIVENVTANEIIQMFKNIKTTNYKSVMPKYVKINQIPQLSDAWKYINKETQNLIKQLKENTKEKHYL